MSITLDISTKFELEMAEVTQEEGLTPNEIITKALSDYFFERKFRRIREKMQNQAQRIHTDEEIFIKKNDNVTLPHAKRRKRQFGSAKGLISMAPNFDEPLEDFRESSE